MISGIYSCACRWGLCQPVLCDTKRYVKPQCIFVWMCTREEGNVGKWIGGGNGGRKTGEVRKIRN